MRKLLSIVVLLLSCGWAVAQPLSESYYRENPSWIDAELWASDGDYYTLRSDSYAPFEEFSIYGFSFVDYAFRGESSASLIYRLGQMDISSPLERYPDYALLTLLRRAPSWRDYHYTTSLRGHSTDVRTERFETSPLECEELSRVRLQLSSRSYRLGVGYELCHRVSDSVAYSLAVGGRWGNDSAVEGLYGNDGYLWFSREWVREVREGVESSLQLALMVAPRERSQRSWNTEEVLTLAGTTTYNSYWGYQGDRVRSARIRREAVPTLYASWNLDDSYILSNINISALVRGGRRSRTSLEWSDAPNPTPDYWGYLPSGQSDPEVALLAEDVWLEGDSRYTQISWQSLYDINHLSTQGAHYLLMDECRDLLSASLDASAALLGVNGGRVGVRGELHSAHDYNTPRDMLGAKSVGEGFDLYDYNLRHASWELYASLYGDYEAGRLFGAVEIGSSGLHYHSATTSRRRGNDSFLSFSLKGGWSRPLSADVRVGAVARYEAAMPYVEELYGALQGAMSYNPYASLEGRSGADVWCEATIGELRLNLTLYGEHRAQRSAVEQFWHDPSDQYAVLMAGGIGSLCVGAELSAELRPTRSLTLEGHLALGRYRYTSDGVATIVSHDTGREIVASTPLRLRGLTSSSSPELLSALVVRYYTPRGWLVGLEGVLAAERVVEPSLLLASDHLQSMASTPEELSSLREQQSLGAASSLNLFLYRRFSERWSLSLSLRNLLSSTEAYRGGYQPSRVKMRESDNIRYLAPHDERYQHIYPRHAYLTVTYDF